MDRPSLREGGVRLGISTDVLAHAVGAALLVNAVPHTVHGVSGKEFPSPFAQPPGVGRSSPSSNIVWGGLNAAAGASLLFGVGSFHFGANRDTLLTGAAASLAAFGLARYFGSLEEPAS